MRPYRTLQPGIAFCLISLVAVSLDAAPRPNVVLIISDDQGWTDYGFMGHPTIQTPRLDALAAQSLLFTRGYCPVSLCRPSLACLATGLYPHQHGITSNDPPRGPRDQRLEQNAKMIAKFEESSTVMGLLGRAGYVSHQSGKWWEGHPRVGKFTEGMTHGDPQRGGRHGDDGLDVGRKTMQPIFDFIAGASRAKKPFFIWYAPFLPHTPHRPPERILRKYRKEGRALPLARYQAMCEWFDETCGQLLDHLDENGLTENTLVCFVTDNGWTQRTPSTPVPSGWRFSHAPKSKRSPYDGGLRTPVMLRWPGHIEARRDEETLINSVDLVPTILAACSVPVPENLPGLDLRDREALRARDTIFGATFLHDAVDIDRPVSSLMYRWCIRGKWKLIVPHFANVADRQVELYDLRADPRETTDLIEKRPEEASRLLQTIDAWWPVGQPRNRARR